VAARRREQLTATVTAAVPLDDAQRQRLVRALSAIYDGPVQINVMLDPAVVGGIRVQVGDEVVDGTILRRLQEAERALLL
jgi:F-type H+-transporting ATPase subunit delta